LEKQQSSPVPQHHSLSPREEAEKIGEE